MSPPSGGASPRLNTLQRVGSGASSVVNSGTSSRSFAGANMPSTSLVRSSSSPHSIRIGGNNVVSSSSPRTAPSLPNQNPLVVTDLSSDLKSETLSSLNSAFESLRSRLGETVNNASGFKDSFDMLGVVLDDCVGTLSSCFKENRLEIKHLTEENNRLRSHLLAAEKAFDDYNFGDDGNGNFDYIDPDFSSAIRFDVNGEISVNSNGDMSRKHRPLDSRIRISVARMRAAETDNADMRLELETALKKIEALNLDLHDGVAIMRRAHAFAQLKGVIVHWRQHNLYTGFSRWKAWMWEYRVAKSLSQRLVSDRNKDKVDALRSGWDRWVRWMYVQQSNAAWLSKVRCEEDKLLHLKRESAFDRLGAVLKRWQNSSVHCFFFKWKQYVLSSYADRMKAESDSSTLALNDQLKKQRQNSAKSALLVTVTHWRHEGIRRGWDAWIRFVLDSTKNNVWQSKMHDVASELQIIKRNACADRLGFIIRHWRDIAKSKTFARWKEFTVAQIADADRRRKEQEVVDVTEKLHESSRSARVRTISLTLQHWRHRLLSYGWDRWMDLMSLVSHSNEWKEHQSNTENKLSEIRRGTILQKVGFVITHWRDSSKARTFSKWKFFVHDNTLSKLRVSKEQELEAAAFKRRLDQNKFASTKLRFLVSHWRNQRLRHGFDLWIHWHHFEKEQVNLSAKVNDATNQLQSVRRSSAFVRLDHYFKTGRHNSICNAFWRWKECWYLSVIDNENKIKESQIADLSNKLKFSTCSSGTSRLNFIIYHWRLLALCRGWGRWVGIMAERSLNNMWKVKFVEVGTQLDNAKKKCVAIHMNFVTRLTRILSRLNMFYIWRHFAIASRYTRRMSVNENNLTVANDALASCMRKSKSCQLRLYVRHWRHLKYSYAWMRWRQLMERSSFQLKLEEQENLFSEKLKNSHRLSVVSHLNLFCKQIRRIQLGGAWTRWREHVLMRHLRRIRVEKEEEIILANRDNASNQICSRRLALALVIVQWRHFSLRSALVAWKNLLSQQSAHQKWQEKIESLHMAHKIVRQREAVVRMLAGIRRAHSLYLYSSFSKWRGYISHTDYKQREKGLHETIEKQYIVARSLCQKLCKQNFVNTVCHYRSAYLLFGMERWLEYRNLSISDRMLKVDIKNEKERVAVLHREYALTALSRLIKGWKDFTLCKAFCILKMHVLSNSVVRREAEANAIVKQTELSNMESRRSSAKCHLSLNVKRAMEWSKKYAFGKIRSEAIIGKLSNTRVNDLELQRQYNRLKLVSLACSNTRKAILCYRRQFLCYALFRWKFYVYSFIMQRRILTLDKVYNRTRYLLSVAKGVIVTSAIRHIFHNYLRRGWDSWQFWMTCELSRRHEAQTIENVEASYDCKRQKLNNTIANLKSSSMNRIKILKSFIALLRNRHNFVVADLELQKVEILEYVRTSRLASASRGGANILLFFGRYWCRQQITFAFTLWKWFIRQTRERRSALSSLEIATSKTKRISLGGRIDRLELAMRQWCYFSLKTAFINWRQFCSEKLLNNDLDCSVVDYKNYRVQSKQIIHTKNIACLQFLISRWSKLALLRAFLNWCCFRFFRQLNKARLVDNAANSSYVLKLRKGCALDRLECRIKSWKDNSLQWAWRLWCFYMSTIASYRSSQRQWQNVSRKHLVCTLSYHRVQYLMYGFYLWKSNSKHISWTTVFSAQIAHLENQCKESNSIYYKELSSVKSCSLVTLFLWWRRKSLHYSFNQWIHFMGLQEEAQERFTAVEALSSKLHDQRKRSGNALLSSTLRYRRVFHIRLGWIIWKSSCELSLSDKLWNQKMETVIRRQSDLLKKCHLVRFGMSILLWKIRSLSYGYQRWKDFFRATQLREVHTSLVRQHTVELSALSNNCRVSVKNRIVDAVLLWRFLSLQSFFRLWKIWLYYEELLQNQNVELSENLCLAKENIRMHHLSYVVSHWRNFGLNTAMGRWRQYLIESRLERESLQKSCLMDSLSKRIVEEKILEKRTLIRIVLQRWRLQRLQFGFTSWLYYLSSVAVSKDFSSKIRFTEDSLRNVRKSGMIFSLKYSIQIMRQSFLWYAFSQWRLLVARSYIDERRMIYDAEQGKAQDRFVKSRKNARRAQLRLIILNWRKVGLSMMFDHWVKFLRNIYREQHKIKFKEECLSSIKDAQMTERHLRFGLIMRSVFQNMQDRCYAYAFSTWRRFIFSRLLEEGRRRNVEAVMKIEAFHRENLVSCRKFHFSNSIICWKRLNLLYFWQCWRHYVRNSVKDRNSVEQENFVSSRLLSSRRNSASEKLLMVVNCWTENAMARTFNIWSSLARSRKVLACKNLLSADVSRLENDLDKVRHTAVVARLRVMFQTKRRLNIGWAFDRWKLIGITKSATQWLTKIEYSNQLVADCRSRYLFSLILSWRLISMAGFFHSWANLTNSRRKVKWAAYLEKLERSCVVDRRQRSIHLLEMVLRLYQICSLRQGWDAWRHLHLRHCWLSQNDQMRNVYQISAWHLLIMSIRTAAFKLLSLGFHQWCTVHQLRKLKESTISAHWSRYSSLLERNKDRAKMLWLRERWALDRLATRFRLVGMAYVALAFNQWKHRLVWRDVIKSLGFLMKQRTRRENLRRSIEILGDYVHAHQNARRIVGIRQLVDFISNLGYSHQLPALLKTPEGLPIDKQFVLSLRMAGGIGDRLTQHGNLMDSTIAADADEMCELDRQLSALHEQLQTTAMMTAVEHGHETDDDDFDYERFRVDSTDDESDGGHIRSGRSRRSSRSSVGSIVSSATD